MQPSELKDVRDVMRGQVCAGQDTSRSVKGAWTASDASVGEMEASRRAAAGKNEVIAVNIVPAFVIEPTFSTVIDPPDTEV